MERDRRLRQLVRVFFQANPEEELSFQDVCTKFTDDPAPASTVSTLLRSLQQQGLIERVVIYRAKNATTPDDRLIWVRRLEAAVKRLEGVSGRATAAQTAPTQEQPSAAA
jgi:hypothetical protein